MSRGRAALLAFALLGACSRTRTEPCTNVLVAMPIPEGWASWPVVAEGHVSTRDDGDGPFGAPASIAEVSLQKFVVLHRLSGPLHSNPYLEISQAGCTASAHKADIRTLQGGQAQRLALGRTHYGLSLRSMGQQYVVTTIDPAKPKDGPRLPVAAFELKAR